MENKKIPHYIINPELIVNQLPELPPGETVMTMVEAKSYSADYHVHREDYYGYYQSQMMRKMEDEEMPTFEQFLNKHFTQKIKEDFRIRGYVILQFDLQMSMDDQICIIKSNLIVYKEKQDGTK